MKPRNNLDKDRKILTLIANHYSTYEDDAGNHCQVRKVAERENVSSSRVYCPCYFDHDPDIYGNRVCIAYDDVNQL